MVKRTVDVKKTVRADGTEVRQHKRVIDVPDANASMMASDSAVLADPLARAPSHGEMPSPDEVFDCGECNGGEMDVEYECSQCEGAGEEEVETDDGEYETVRCEDCGGAGVEIEREDCSSPSCADAYYYDTTFANDVDSALAHLNSQGFETMSGTSCCMGCSFSEAKTAGRDDDGNPKEGYYPFIGFHVQDLERAYERPEGGMHLFHDLTDEDAARAVKHLEDMDLKVDWDGNHAGRIVVYPTEYDN